MRTGTALPGACVALAVLVMSLGSTPAAARTDGTLAYPYDQVWTSTVRLIRIDYGYAIREKDKDDGYVLFEYKDARGERTYKGSVQLARVTERDQKVVKVIFEIPEMPSYIESMLLDKLKQKMRDKYGEPLPPPPPKKPPAQAPPGDKPGKKPADKPDEGKDRAPAEAPAEPGARPSASSPTDASR